MITIRTLFNRIRWDRAYSQGKFAIGYYDRVEDRVIVVPFDEVGFDPDDRCAMHVATADGPVHSIPLHRVCLVYRNGELIWERKRR